MDSWPLTDADGNQYSVNGQEIIFSLVADRSLDFDDRHVFAKIGYFYRDAKGNDIKPYDPRIALSVGHVHTNKNGVKFTGFDKVIPLLEADGTYYQTAEQNPYFNFRDPFTFKDSAHPGETYMVFEGNSAMPRASAKCTAEGSWLSRG